ncbi:VOC family protein [Desulfovibrio sp. OttesenSCG-928-O18]|nr:VOC family protein [Desulfovibrio sp. OttesenSCG-928-O18]
MKFTFAHNNINVLDLEKSMEFYRKALNLTEARRLEMPTFTLVYLGDGATGYLLELTFLHDRKKPYDLGENEFHLAMLVDDYDAAHALHKSMGCICYENEKMGIYFIKDPDGYWIEILPASKFS